MRYRKKYLHTYILTTGILLLSALSAICQQESPAAGVQLKAYYVVVPAGSLRSQEVARAALRWEAMPPGGINLGVLPGKEVWLKVVVHLPESSGQKQTWGLALGNAFLDEVVFFQEEAMQRRWQPCRDSSAGARHSSLFPQCSIQSATARFLVKVHSETPLLLPLYCLPLQELHKKEAAYFLFYGLFSGFTAMLFLLACLAWIYFKERVYGYFALFLLGSGLTLGISAGVLSWYLPISWQLAKLLLNTAIGIWVIGAVGLVRALVPREYLPGWVTFSLKLYLGFGLALLWASWLFPYAFVSVLAGIIAMLMNVIITYGAWRAWQRGERALFFLVIGWGFYTLSMGGYIIASLLGKGLFLAHYHWAEISLLTQSLFFVLALFHRYSLWQTAHMRERLAIEEEKAELYQSISTQLQSDLQEKLKRLQQQKEEIETQNEELLQQSIQLAEQHKQIEKQLEEIKQLNVELEARVAEHTAELEASNERLLHYARQVEDYAFALAHNLRAPLARIMGLAQLMEIESKQAGGAAVGVSVESLVQSIVKSAYEADEVLHDLNEIVAIRAEGLVAVRLVPVQEVVNEVLPRLKARYACPLHLEEDYQVSLLHANRVYLADVIEEILDNCFRFRNPARTLCIRIRTCQASDSEHAIIIEDNGLGLDVAAFAGKIWHPYQTFHANSGRGIGLYMAKVKVEAMGGNIEICGEVDKGVSVRILLPVKK